MIFQNCLKNFTHVTAREITHNNFEISLEVFMPNITTNHAVTYTNGMWKGRDMDLGAALPRKNLLNTP